MVDKDLHIASIAVSDKSDYNYADTVAYEISETEQSAYRPAANFINRTGYDVLSIQHEYGIFGGDDGIYLMNLVREAKMPIVTTLHTVLQDPTPSQRVVMNDLLKYSERIVVMSETAVRILNQVHGVPSEKIDLIPHGIPDISTVANTQFRESLNISGPMILTFGLLSPDKGVQYVIRAMPKILEALPGATYVVVGATHPNIRATAGESYRSSLENLARELGVEDNVRFIDRFVSSDELVDYLGAMDFYVTPYLNARQITSGTLAYALGAGKAVISTPYIYAEELLSDGRGVLVPFQDSEAIADAVLMLYESPKVRLEMGQRAVEYCKSMLWPQVGKRYLECFQQAKHDSSHRIRNLIIDPSASIELPAVHFTHLGDLTDDTGILQHSKFTIPNRAEGYCVDDNSRALLLTALLEHNRPLSSQLSLLQSRYLSFVLDAFNLENRRFRNFMSYDRTWLEEAGSEDSQGRTLWALGTVVHRSRDRNRRGLAQALFDEALPPIYQTTSLRTWAYAILGCDAYLKAFPNNLAALSLLRSMADRLFSEFTTQQDEKDWPWFEQSLTYGNARLPQALIVAGQVMGESPMIQAGIQSLRWLIHVQTSPQGSFAPVGSQEFYVRNQTRSYYDQQPIEAVATVSACLSASQVSHRTEWRKHAHWVFRWFMGENMLSQPLYDENSGGCCDGLHDQRVNLNQGAESTLSFHLALAELQIDEALMAQVNRHSSKAAVDTAFAKKQLSKDSPRIVPGTVKLI